MGDDVETLRDALPKHSPEWWAAHRIVRENERLKQYALATQYWRLEPVDQTERRAYLAKLGISASPPVSKPESVSRAETHGGPDIET